MSTLDEEALATLTQEERDAINGEEYTPENKEALARIAANASDDDDEDDDSDDDGAPVERAPAKAEAVIAKDVDPTTGAIDHEADSKRVSAAQTTPVAQYSAELPADYADKVADLDTRRAKIEADFEAGEFDTAEQRRLLAELSTDRDNLLITKARAETLQTINDSNRQSAQQAFETAFVARTKNDGVDYAQPKNQRLFNTMLADLAEDNPEQTEAWFWENAHAAVLRSRGITATAKADPTPLTPKEAVAAAVAARKTPIDSAPKTLAQVPGSDGPGDVQGEFADIDALDGLDLEDAIRRMTPAAREKYLRG